MKRSSHHSCATGEFGQDAHAAFARRDSWWRVLFQCILVRNRKLQGKQVQSVPNRRHDNHVRRTQQSHTLRQSHFRLLTFLELDSPGPSAINLLDQLADLSLCLVIIISTFWGRYANLDEHDP